MILQTSVRTCGGETPWLLDRETVVAKATNVVEGDLGDPASTLLLFVIARAA